jgi:hypothetical protein
MIIDIIAYVLKSILHLDDEGMRHFLEDGSLIQDIDHFIIFLNFILAQGLHSIYLSRIFLPHYDYNYVN